MLKKGLLFFFLLLFVLSACSNSTGGTNTTEKNVKEASKNTYKDYYGTYYQIETGTLSGNYFDDYERVPLEPYHGNSTIQLKSDGTYITKYDGYTEDHILFAQTTSKYEYKFDGFNVIRNRNITEKNSMFQKKILYYDGEHYFKDSLIEEYLDHDATILKEDEDSIVYDITKWRIANNEHDSEENHLENDFVTVEGLLISVNYYFDDDKTSVSIYEKR